MQQLKNHQCFISRDEMNKYWEDGKTMGLLLKRDELELFVREVLPIIGSSYSFYFWVDEAQMSIDNLNEILIYSANQQCYYNIGYYSRKHIFEKKEMSQ